MTTPTTQARDLTDTAGTVMTTVDEGASTPPEPRRYHPGHATFPGLDGLRALAVLAVVTTHSAFWTGRLLRAWLGETMP